MKTYGGSGCIDTRILDFGTSWRWTVSFTPRLFYSPEKEPPVPIGLDYVEKRKISPLPGLELQPVGRPARSQSLYRLRYPGFYHQKMITNYYEYHYFKLLAGKKNPLGGPQGSAGIQLTIPDADGYRAPELQTRAQTLVSYHPEIPVLPSRTV
jgi:hypothetical protein